MIPPMACEAKICQGWRISIRSFGRRRSALGATRRDTYIEAVIILEQELELRGKVAERAGHEAKQDRGGCEDGNPTSGTGKWEAWAVGRTHTRTDEA